MLLDGGAGSKKRGWPFDTSIDECQYRLLHMEIWPSWQHAKKGFHTCSLLVRRLSWRSTEVGTVLSNGLRSTKGRTIVFVLVLCRFGGRLSLLSITKVRIDCCLDGGSNRLAPSYDCRSQRIGLFDGRDRTLRKA